MFTLRYASSELRRRASRTIFTALGLAAGVGLVIGIVGVSQGLEAAQEQVLSPLSKVGTDILVTRVAGAAPSDGSASSAETTTTSTTLAQGPGGGGAAASTCVAGGGFFGPGGGRGPAAAAGATTTTTPAQAANEADCAALLADNDTVLTDLSKLGPAGTAFSHDFFLPATLLTFPDSAIAEVADVPGVTAAVGGLTLLAQHQTGTVPNITVDVSTAEENITQTVRPDPLTADEQVAVRECLESKGFTFGGGAAPGATTTTTSAPAATTTSAPTTTAPPETTTTAEIAAASLSVTRTVTAAQTAPPPDGGPGGGPGRGDNQAFQDCQPARIREYQTNVVIPARQIQQIVNPPATNTANSSYTAAGIDPSSPESGLVTAEQVKDGRFLKAGADAEVLVSASYAEKKDLAVGGPLTINDESFTVVGIVNPGLTGGTADVYFSLAKLQALGSKAGRINQVLVKASSAADVDRVAKAISELLPGAQIVTSKSLSSQVTGSLADAKSLADRLGGALAAIVLASVFVIAVLLTLASVAKRVREIGTLRAIGWPKAMVVRQILTETIGIGILGGVAGVGVGYGVAALVGAFSPSFEATSSGIPSFGTSTITGFLPTSAQAAAITQTVHLEAVVRPGTLLLGVGLAILGGVIAGTFGGWRAARLSPSEALRNVG